MLTLDIVTLTLNLTLSVTVPLTLPLVTSMLWHLVNCIIIVICHFTFLSYLVP